MASANKITITFDEPLTMIAKDSGEVLQSYDKLEFREPTAGDIVSIGNPVIFEPTFTPPRISHDAPRMNEMLARLAGVTPMLIAQMRPADWVTCAWRVSSFFLPRV